MDDIPFILLAGGFGTRLRSVLPDQPKCLAPVCSKPFLYYLLDQIAAAPCSRLLISVHFLSEHITKEIGSRYKNVFIDYIREETPLGTGGAIRLAMNAFADDTFVVMNADSFLDIPIADFLSPPPEAGEVCVAAVEMNSCVRFGRLILGENETISGFVEKSQSDGAGWINAGLYHFQRSALEKYEIGRPFSLEKELFPLLAEQGKLKTKKFKAPFIDIGTPESFEEAQLFFARLGN